MPTAIAGVGLLPPSVLFFRMISQKTMQLGSLNLTFSTMSPGNPFILVSKGQRARNHKKNIQQRGTIHCCVGLVYIQACVWLYSNSALTFLNMADAIPATGGIGAASIANHLGHRAAREETTSSGVLRNSRPRHQNCRHMLQWSSRLKALRARHVKWPCWKAYALAGSGCRNLGLPSDHWLALYSQWPRWPDLPVLTAWPRTSNCHPTDVGRMPADCDALPRNASPTVKYSC